MLDFDRPGPADGPAYERLFLDPQVQRTSATAPAYDFAGGSVPAAIALDRR